MGKASFKDLRTFEGTVCETYQEVCRLLGLLQDDKEWDDVLTEGAATKLSSALRELFVTILLFSMPANPKELFETHYLEWTDDFTFEAETKGVIFDEQQMRTLVLIDLKKRMQSWERQLSAFGLKEPTQEELEAVNISSLADTDAILREELSFVRSDLMNLVDSRKSQFTYSQRVVFETALQAVA